MKKVLATLILGLSAWAPTVFATGPEAAYRGTPPSHENRMHAGDLPQTLVIRKDVRSGRISVMHMKNHLSSRPSTSEELATDNPSAWFYPWSFYWNYNYYSYPYYNYYGYNYYYTPYYSYYTYPYYYSYYSWCW